MKLLTKGGGSAALRILQGQYLLPTPTKESDHAAHHSGLRHT